MGKPSFRKVTLPVGTASPPETAGAASLAEMKSGTARDVASWGGASVVVMVAVRSPAPFD